MPPPTGKASAGAICGKLFGLYRLAAAAWYFVNYLSALMTTFPVMPPLPLSAAARQPAPGANVASPIRQLEAVTMVEIDGASRSLGQTVLEGHRFAVRAITPGEPLLSWGLPFGHALSPIAPGDYVCNRSILEALAVRRLP